MSGRFLETLLRPSPDTTTRSISKEWHLLTTDLISYTEPGSPQVPSIKAILYHESGRQMIGFDENGQKYRNGSALDPKVAQEFPRLCRPELRQNGKFLITNKAVVRTQEFVEALGIDPTETPIVVTGHYWQIWWRIN